MTFEVRGIEIEGGNDPGVDVQYPWEDMHGEPIVIGSMSPTFISTVLL